MTSEVESPTHYTVGGVEALGVIKAKLMPKEYVGYLKGNIMKYLMRANYKGSHNVDCEKASYYAQELERVLDEQETEQKITSTKEWFRGQGVTITRDPRDFL